MKNKHIEKLIRHLIQIYGKRYNPWATSEDIKEETGFKLSGIDVSFSVIIGNDEENMYSIQIESSPPGDYLYCNEVNFEQLIELIKIFEGPSSSWPNDVC